ncbi:MAG: TlpA family protein disulfide reductase, partial [Planctomycetales bacterium]|nr:TlpA family protein disulfide reductase [Planctomycetales bacterium]
PDDAERIDGSVNDRSAQTSGAAAPKPPESPTAFELASSPPPGADGPEMIGAPVAESSAGGRTLNDNLTADQLAEFLQYSDRDMQMLASGQSQVTDPAEASKLMRTFALNKHQAAIRLQSHPNATAKQRVDGLRGQLQALSHLSAMGDLASAKALESLARENLGSAEPTIAGDSRIVLIGFAIDALQGGRETAADQIVSLIQGMSASPNQDVPAVLMMAEARQTLANYGLIDHAAKVREKILELYGNSSDATIAQVAADAAGTAKFDPVSRLLAAILKDEQVELSRWTDAVTELATDSPDMNTVQFLGLAALQLESAGRNDFVKATFDILGKTFADAQSATAREIATAREAMEARRSVIGTEMDFDQLPSVDGKGVPRTHYQGKVVLMPFWAVVIPNSLEIIGMLNEIQKEHPDQVAIVGMNLDPEQAPLREFLLKNDLGFPSYRSMSSATADVANPVAARFGLVSFPFVAIFNQDGKVEGLDFTGDQIESIVDRLTSQSKN